jgi:gluconokinase
VIVVVAGVSGSGKTTVAALLSGHLGWPFTDGDLLHPAANIAKMAKGVPLTDADRQPWLQAIAALMDERIAAGQSAIVACSALKRAYRDLLLTGRPSARMAFLLIAEEIVARRLAVRHDHFFDGRLLRSQFADLEPPVPDETAVIVVPERGGPEATAEAVIALLNLGGPAAGGDRHV